MWKVCIPFLRFWTAVLLALRWAEDAWPMKPERVDATREMLDNFIVMNVEWFSLFRWIVAGWRDHVFLGFPRASPTTAANSKSCLRHKSQWNANERAAKIVKWV